MPADAELDRLAALYAPPGAFVASINWYRAGSGTSPRALAGAARAGRPDRRADAVLWPEHDPLFPREWADRLDEFFADVDLRLLPEAGHFSPLEAPDAVAAAIREGPSGQKPPDRRDGAGQPLVALGGRVAEQLERDPPACARRAPPRRRAASAPPSDACPAAS